MTMLYLYFGLSKRGILVETVSQLLNGRVWVSCICKWLFEHQKFEWIILNMLKCLLQLGIFFLQRLEARIRKLWDIMSNLAIECFSCLRNTFNATAQCYWHQLDGTPTVTQRKIVGSFIRSTFASRSGSVPVERPILSNSTCWIFHDKPRFHFFPIKLFVMTFNCVIDQCNVTRYEYQVRMCIAVRSSLLRWPSDQIVLRQLIILHLAPSWASSK